MSKKAKVCLLANKVLATICRNACGIIYINYFQNERTMYEEYHDNPLIRFNNNLNKNQSYLAKLVMVKFNELGYELVPHPRYSPDLASSDFPVEKVEQKARREQFYIQQ